MLSVSHLTCQRGERVLFQDLSFDLSQHHWLQIAGANGAGKTSLLRILAGLTEPAEGSVSWQGKPLKEDRSVFHSQLLYLGHHPALKDELTPLENVLLGLGMEGFRIPRSEVVKALKEFGLEGRLHLPARYLSAGQRRRVLLSRLMLRPARLWILDEPFTALDTHATQLLTDLIQSHLARQGMAILTSHQPIGLPSGSTLNL